MPDQETAGKTGSRVMRLFRENTLLSYGITVVLPVLLIAVLVSAMVSDPDHADYEGQIQSALGVRKPEKAEIVLEKLVDLQPQEIMLHRNLIHVHFMRSERDEPRTDEWLFDRYIGYSVSDNPVIRDIGYYGLGLILSSGPANYEMALQFYRQVSNQSMPYLSNSIGYCYMQLGKLTDAEAHFVAELALDGNRAGALTNLSRVYSRRGEWSRVRQLLDDHPDAAVSVPFGIHRRLLLSEGRFVAYMGLVLYQSVQNINPAGLTAAFCILAIWFIFLRRLDVFEPERFRYLLLILVLGMLSAPACHILYDVYRFGLGFSLNGGLWNDFFYCIFGIGLVEELVKVIPLVILMKFSRQVNETTDYVVYAGISALGFAFMENLLYFGDTGLISIHSRAFTAVVLHLSLSVLAVRGLVRTHRTEASTGLRTLWFLAGFFAAVVLHGLYDFFLLSQQVQMPAVSFVLLLVMLGLFQRIVINALNRSRFWGPEAKYRFVDRIAYLKYGLAVVVLVEYLLLAWLFGPLAANSHMVGVVFQALLMIAVLAHTLGVLPLERGLTVPLYSWKGLFRKDKSHME